MNIKKIAFGVLIALVTTLGHATASTVLDTDATGGWSNGTGTFNGHFTLDQEAGGVEIGLRAGIRGGGGGPITPNTGTSLYDAPIGTAGVPPRALWNIEYSINTGTLSGLTALLTVTDGTNTASFNPLAISDNTTNADGAKQNSENLTFGFFGALNFDPNALKTYTFDLTLSDATGAQVSFVEIEVAAVPEPSTWAMMILGFAGIGFVAYRRKQNGSALRGA
jgi:hypothetical protein